MCSEVRRQLLTHSVFFSGTLLAFTVLNAQNLLLVMDSKMLRLGQDSCDRLGSGSLLDSVFCSALKWNDDRPEAEKGF